MSFKGLKMLEIRKLPDFEKNWKSFKNMHRGDPWKKMFFSFLFNTLFYTRQSQDTIRISFRGLRMLKNPKLTQCYPFAVVLGSSSASLASSPCSASTPPWRCPPARPLTSSPSSTLPSRRLDPGSYRIVYCLL